MELKKWAALALAGTMCFSMLAACGGDDEEYVEEDEIVDEEIVDEEPVEDEEYVEDEEAVEDEEYMEEGTPITEDTAIRLAAFNAVVGTAMVEMGENYTDDTMPEDAMAILPDMLALSQEHSSREVESYTEEEALAYMDEMAPYANVLLQYVEVDEDTVAQALLGE